MIELEDDGNCFVCGTLNPSGLGIEFQKTDEGAIATFSAEKRFQGYKNIIHGGIIAALLDEASVKALVMRGIKAVTAEITLRFRTPLRIGERATIHAYIGQQRGRVFEIEAEMKKGNGEIVALSKARVFQHGE